MVGFFTYLRTYCRGGPPWPPSVGIAFAKPRLSLLESVPTKGGHGGPPLQYVPWGFNSENQAHWAKNARRKCLDLVHVLWLKTLAVPQDQ